MAIPLISFNIKALPNPGDPARAERGLARWRERGDADDELSAFIDSLAVEPSGRALLDAVFGNSPHLTRCFLQESEFVREILTVGPDRTFDDLLSELKTSLADETSLGKVAAELRKAKRKAALAIGLADIAGLWPLERVTGALTDFAEAALRISVRYALGSAAANDSITLNDESDPERNSGYIVLGMGKLGARELNYSSDIDLIVLYDAAKIRGADPDRLGKIFVKATRQLLHLMDARTADGYVFRTDLRLRPDPGAMPLAVSVEAAEVYYESVGQNWERAAMIKARPVAGDIAAGEAFLQHLRPYIWRRNLDFAAIQDVHSIKRQINAYRGGATIAVNGHNIKLGRGGIREIEFFCQTQQLIWGGRDPGLRDRATEATLVALVESGHLRAEAAKELKAAYRFLRTLEHRLQMIDDKQTHEIPKSDDGIAAVGVFMGYPDTETFRADLLMHLHRVEHHYARLFEESPDLGGAGALVFTGFENHPDTVKTLEEMGFADGGSVSNVVRGWHHGRYRATRSERARQILTELMPRLLKAFADSANPDAAFARFDEFIAGLPSGVQLFSLFHANPPLLDMVAEIMGGAPRIADWLSRNPNLLDAVLSADFMEPLESASELEMELQALLEQAENYEDVLELTRRWTSDRKFRVGVQILRGIVGGAAAGDALTAIADTVLSVLLPRVEAEFAHRHGHVPGGGLAIVALGKLGSGELSPGSDLDLVFVYDHKADAEASDGEKPLAPGVWFGRLCQRLVSAISAPTAAGNLYEIDMRLRPSGNAGPTASRLDGFEKYYREQAWTWEHMALTRARVAAATAEKIDHRATTVICGVLAAPRNPDRLVVDAAEMRNRIAGQHKGDNPWDVKHCDGGLVDIEFLAQYFQLLYGPEHPRVFAENTADALGRMGETKLVPVGTIAELTGALELWWRLQNALRLIAPEGLVDGEIPESTKAALARACGMEEFGSLRRAMDEAAGTAHGHFRTLIEEPAEQARARLPTEGNGEGG